MKFAVLALSLMLPALASASEEPLYGPPGIPPGQEKLLLLMLGKDADLPDGCELESGEIDYTVVKAEYECRFGEVKVELAHVSESLPSDTLTEFFAIAVVEGSASDNLTNALAARIHQREGDFIWLFPARSEGADPAAPVEVW